MLHACAECRDCAKPDVVSDIARRVEVGFSRPEYYGSLTPAVKYPEKELAMLLNTMVMVYGGNNILLFVPAPDADQTQGCIVMAAHIPLVVEAMMLIVATLLVSLTALLFTYALILFAKDRVLKEATRHLPDTSVAWAAMAAKEHRISKQADYSGRVRQRGLKDWVVGLEVVDGQRKLRVLPAEAISDEIPLQNGANWSQRRLLA